MGIVLAPTITKLPPGTQGAVLVTGSHGGLYPGRLAVLAGVRAVLLHDAGIGLDAAGVASLVMLERLGIAAAAASHLTCRVGDTADIMARGRVSRANRQAVACGIVAGMSCAEAATLLGDAPWLESRPDVAEEGRTVQRPDGAIRALVLIDSAAMVDPTKDRGTVVVTGSHGGLVGGDPAMALRADAFAAAYNDAGIGIDQAGLQRLPALDTRGIAAITVAATSARIGSARSTFEDGTISAANECAQAMGARTGDCARDTLLAWTR